ncbi:hypothetical protein PWR05_35820 [Paraburkholderia sp. A2RI-6]|uniref:hypothetical protein n=1 Tax=Paraburkholderia sp. A2RI-6 TaxID=3028371 RepID=UPI003B7826CA
MGEMRNAHRVNLLDDRLPVVEKPATIQVEELNEVSVGWWKWQIKVLQRDHSARVDELRALEPIAFSAVGAEPDLRGLDEMEGSQPFAAAGKCEELPDHEEREQLGLRFVIQLLHFSASAFGAAVLLFGTRGGAGNGVPLF